MKALIPIDNHGMFADRNDIARVDSRFVAKEFGKRHDNVLKDIKNLDCSEQFRLLNFEESTYVNEQNHRQPCCQMTRDGFTFLVMGYRGKKAAAFKEAYIRRFNEMEAQIRNLVAARMECPRLTENIKALHEEPKSYHYSNELDMINRIVLGMSAKRFREAHSIPDGQSIRPYLTEQQTADIERLQHADVGLTLAVADYHERKRLLTQYRDRLAVRS